MIYSPIIKEYSTYTLFPKGIFLLFYDDHKKYHYIQSNWVKLTKNNFYHLKGDVQLVSSDGNLLKTEEIFWNKKKKIFFNTKYTTVNFYGISIYSKKGIETSYNLDKITLKNISGVIPLYIKII